MPPRQLADAVALAREACEPMRGVDRKVPEDNARAREGWVRHATDDFEFVFVGPAWQDVEGLPGSGRGEDALGRAFGEWMEPFESYRMWPVDYAGKGDRALVTLRAEVRLPGQSTPFEQQHGLIVTARDGQIAKAELYLEAADAVAAFERL